MIKFENTQVVGLGPAIRGMRNPMNSWDKSDSYRQTTTDGTDEYIVGESDLGLMKRLREAGTDHRKYLRMIQVYVDITAPLYWWKEFDTYKVGTVANSCSTMHKITAKEFEWDDFSHDHLEMLEVDNKYCHDFREYLMDTIDALNIARKGYLLAKTKPMKEEGKRAENVKRYWWQMIQLLPSSYNQKRTVLLNYEVLANIYKPSSRQHHKLDEWNVDKEGSFCQWIKSLPYAELITGEVAE